MRTRRSAFVVGTAMAAVAGLFFVHAGQAGEAGRHGAERHGHHHAKMANELPASEDHLAKILEHRPEADADGDGVLTKEEAKAFIHSRHSESKGQLHETECHGRHAKMIHELPGSEEHLATVLEHHPEADAIGDGVLSKEEARTFVQSGHGDAGDCHGPEGRGHHGKLGEEAGASVHSRHGDAGDCHGSKGHGHHGKMGAVGMVLEHLDKLDAESGSVDMILARHPEADADSDGDLSSSEWTAFAKEVRPRLLAHLVSLAPEVDADSDGAVSNDELAAFRSDRSAKIREHVLEKNPDADTDGDGVLSDAELEAFHATRAKEHHTFILERHPEADTDGDGVLSKEEAKTFIHDRHSESGDPHASKAAKHAAHGAR